MFAAGHLYDRVGLTDRADELYAQTLARYPSLASDPYWSRDAGLEARFGGIVELAEQQAPGLGWELALIAGDVEPAP